MSFLLGLALCQLYCQEYDWAWRCICRATLVGTKTFGKGVVQFYFPMDDDGSGLKVTVEKYLGPDGYDISRRGGIEPDVACADYPHGGLASASDDHCIAAALRLIQGAA